MPAIPREIDRDPTPLPTLTDNSMGALVEDSNTVARLYGELAIRFNGLRQLYGCVRDQINAEKTAGTCK